MRHRRHLLRGLPSWHVWHGHGRADPRYLRGLRRRHLLERNWRHRLRKLRSGQVLDRCARFVLRPLPRELRIGRWGRGVPIQCGVL